MQINKMDTNGYWMVGSSNIYIPSAGIEVQHTNVVSADSGRGESGYNHIEWVRRDVRKVCLMYKAMTESELNYMFNLMQGKEFTFTFHDRGITQTMNAYTGECSYKYEQQNYLGKGIGLYTEVKINAIEI